MRSNGLTAAAYSPVADLDPQVATSLLEELRSLGVAAYAKPIESPSAAGFDRPDFRVAVKDRLFVDAAASTQVRELLAARDPELIDDNDDLVWARIVADFDLPSDGGLAPWPEVEDVEPEAQADPAPAAEPVSPPPLMSLDARDEEFLASTRSRSEEPADEERFIPEPPPPLPRLEPYKQLAWAGLFGGPLLFIVVAMFHLQPPALLITAAVIGFVGGFIVLVATMGSGDDDWSSGNGAVV